MTGWGEEEGDLPTYVKGERSGRADGRFAVPVRGSWIAASGQRRTEGERDMQCLRAVAVSRVHPLV